MIRKIQKPVQIRRPERVILRPNAKHCRRVKRLTERLELCAKKFRGRLRVPFGLICRTSYFFFAFFFAAFFLVAIFLFSLSIFHGYAALSEKPQLMNV